MAILENAARNEQENIKLDVVKSFSNIEGISITQGETVRGNLEKQFSTEQLYKFHSTLVARYMRYLKESRQVGKPLSKIQSFGGIVLCQPILDAGADRYSKISDRTGKTFNLNRTRIVYDLDFVPFGDYNPQIDRKIIAETMLLGILDVHKMLTFLIENQDRPEAPNEILAAGKTQIKQIAEALGLSCSKPQVLTRTFRHKRRLAEAILLKLFDKGQRLKSIQWYYIFCNDVKEFLQNAPERVSRMEKKAISAAKKMGIDERLARIDAISHMLDNKDLLVYIKGEISANE